MAGAEVPSLGYEVLDWITEYLIVPDGPLAGEALVPTREQAQFILNLYSVSPKGKFPAVDGPKFRNARLIRRAVLSRPKGWGKSPLLAALCLAEALAPVVPDGWDANGNPVGRPWTSLGFKAKVQIVATSEAQTINTWEPLLEMVREGPVGVEYDVEALDTRINTPRGRIEYTTSSSTSREGFRLVFAVLDQTESFLASIGGDKLAAAIRRNLVKTSGCSVETPNAFVPGEDSVAEKSYEAWQLQEAGKLKRDTGLIYDHREAPEVDVTDEDSLRSAIVGVYGDSTWVDPERVIDDFWDPVNEVGESRRFFLNQITSAEDAWIAQPEWAACKDATKVVADREVITLGFDGSRKRARGVTDATALMACRVSDGHVFEPVDYCVWEQPAGPAGADWQVPVTEVESAIAETFRRYRVVGFFADPAKWESYVAQWEATYSAQLLVKATRDHPIEWWMTGGRSILIVRALQEFHDGVLDRELTHDGSHHLTRHVLNARRRPSRSGIQIGKENPDSPRKIDAAVAAVLAYKARLQALSVGAIEEESFVPVRVR